ncbi:MAG TPA: hypothetical protein VEW48_27825 [Thermoanaerobaculia bacterium]|nr:hypothetical protein [Thermoanaerobaculia bacterium]
MADDRRQRGNFAERSVRAPKAALHHLRQQGVGLFQAEDLPQDQETENSEGTGDVEAERTAQLSSVQIVGKDGESTRNSRCDAGSLSGSQTASDLFCPGMFALSQIEDLQPGPVAERNRSSTYTSL